MSGGGGAETSGSPEYLTDLHHQFMTGDPLKAKYTSTPLTKSLSEHVNTTVLSNPYDSANAYNPATELALLATQLTTLGNNLNAVTTDSAPATTEALYDTDTQFDIGTGVVSRSSSDIAQTAIAGYWDSISDNLTAVKAEAALVANSTITASSGGALADEALVKATAALTAQIDSILPNITGSGSSTTVEKLQSIIEAVAAYTNSIAATRANTVGDVDANLDLARTEMNTLLTSLISDIATDSTTLRDRDVTNVLSQISSVFSDIGSWSADTIASAISSTDLAVAEYIPDSSSMVTSIYNSALGHMNTLLASPEVDAQVDNFEKKHINTHIRANNRYSVGMANIGAINNSAYAIGLMAREEEFTRQVSEFRTKIQGSLLEVSFSKAVDAGIQAALATMQSSVQLCIRNIDLALQEKLTDSQTRLALLQADSQKQMALYNKRLDIAQLGYSTASDYAKLYEQLREDLYKASISTDSQSHDSMYNSLVAAQLQILQGQANLYADTEKSYTQTRAGVYSDTAKNYLNKGIDKSVGKASAETGAFLPLYQQEADLQVKREIQSKMNRLNFTNAMVGHNLTYGQLSASLDQTYYEAHKNKTILDISASVDQVEGDIEYNRAAVFHELDVYQYYANGVSALSGASVQNVSKPNKTASALSNMAGGAAAGATVGGPLGAAIGGAVGLISSL